MAEYVLYCLDGPKLVRCERFNADSEEAAIAEALRRQGLNAGELWCGPHRVRVFTPASADQEPYHGSGNTGVA